MTETNKEKLERLEMMIDDDHGTWDLSENDQAAIEYVLEYVRILETAVEIACNQSNLGKDYLFEMANAAIKHGVKP